jgi:hypothetical protein
LSALLGQIKPAERHIEHALLFCIDGDALGNLQAGRSLLSVLCLYLRVRALLRRSVANA